MGVARRLAAGNPPDVLDNRSAGSNHDTSGTQLG
jgi:hypothetical protein